MISGVWRKLKNGDYPILMLEWRRFRRGKKRAAPGAIAAVLLVIAVVRALVRLDSIPLLDGLVLGVMVQLKVFVLYFHIPVNCARAIAQEHETGSLPMLALTPMSSASVLAQKMAVVLAPAALTSAIVPALVPPLTGSLNPPDALKPFYSLAAADVRGSLAYPIYCFAYAATGIWCSCWHPSSRAAIANTYMVLPCFVVPAYVAIAGWRANSPMDSCLAAALALALGTAYLWRSIGRLDWLRTHIGGKA